MKVLEIGTGSGYQAAILAEIGCEVYSVEIVDELAKQATRVIESMNYSNVYIKSGDGYLGWEEHSLMMLLLLPLRQSLFQLRF